MKFINFNSFFYYKSHIYQNYLFHNFHSYYLFYLHKNVIDFTIIHFLIYILK